MTMYYRNITALTKTCLHSSYLPDHFRFIITSWRLSNHKLKIETGRYTKPITKRELRDCDVCQLLEDESHIIFRCPRVRKLHLKFDNLIKKNHAIQRFLNPLLDDVKSTAVFLHGDETIILK